MGKRTKEHRKKVQARNQKILQAKKKFEKLYTDLLQEKLKEYQEKLSGTTEVVSGDTSSETVFKTED
jgi:hypothetical protein